MNLVYRTYQKGDEEQLAEVYNLAFKPMFPRTANAWKWKYIEKPEFDPESIQICEDADKCKLVGMIASEVHDVMHNGQIVKAGFINDVATIPEYQKLGIGRHLMNRSLDHFNAKQVKFSSLVADPRGHPRSRLYMPFGYKDAMKNKICLKILNMKRLCFKEIKWLIPISPVLYLANLINRSILKLRFRNAPYPPYSIQILKQEHYGEFYGAFNEIVTRNYDMAPIRGKANWQWRREKVPQPDLEPKILVLRNGERIIGGVTLLSRVAHIHKPRLKINMGIIVEYFVDHGAFEDKKEAIEVSGWFNRRIAETAKNMGSSVLLGFIAENDSPANAYFRYSGVLTFNAAAFMIKEHRKESFGNNSDKPIFMPLYDAMGIP